MSEAAGYDVSEETRIGAHWQDLALSQLDALYGFAMSLSRNPHEAEDLVQETFSQAVPHFANLRSDSNVKAWLFAILRNTWLKRLRHDRCGPDFVSLDHVDVELRAVDPNDPYAVCLRIWQREEIRDALESLPEHCAEIIVLCDIEGFTYNEIAEILGCPVGTVMSRLSRARAKFKRALCRWNEPPGHHRAVDES